MTLFSYCDLIRLFLISSFYKTIIDPGKRVMDYIWSLIVGLVTRAKGLAMDWFNKHPYIFYLVRMPFFFTKFYYLFLAFCVRSVTYWIFSRIKEHWMQSRLRAYVTFPRLLRLLIITMAASATIGILYHLFPQECNAMATFAVGYIQRATMISLNTIRVVGNCLCTVYTHISQGCARVWETVCWLYAKYTQFYNAWVRVFGWLRQIYALTVLLPYRLILECIDLLELLFAIVAFAASHLILITTLTASFFAIRVFLSTAPRSHHTSWETRTVVMVDRLADYDLPAKKQLYPGVTARSITVTERKED